MADRTRPSASIRKAVAVIRIPVIKNTINMNTPYWVCLYFTAIFSCKVLRWGYVSRIKFPFAGSLFETQRLRISRRRLYHDKMQEPMPDSTPGPARAAPTGGRTCCGCQASLALKMPCHTTNVHLNSTQSCATVPSQREMFLRQACGPACSPGKV